MRVGAYVIARRYSYQATGDQKAILLLRRISPVAWQQIHFLGRYMFRGGKHAIDLNTLLANVVLA